MPKKNVDINYLRNFADQMEIVDTYIKKYDEKFGHSEKMRFLSEARCALSRAGLCGAVPQNLRHQIKNRAGKIARLEKLQGLALSLRYGIGSGDSDRDEYNEILMSA